MRQGELATGQPVPKTRTLSEFITAAMARLGPIQAAAARERHEAGYQLGGAKMPGRASSGKTLRGGRIPGRPEPSWSGAGGLAVERSFETLVGSTMVTRSCSALQSTAPPQACLTGQLVAGSPANHRNSGSAGRPCRRSFARKSGNDGRRVKKKRCESQRQSEAPKPRRGIAASDLDCSASDHRCSRRK